MKVRIVSRVSFIVVSFLVSILRVYQVGISPFLGGRCRFFPTCSQYTIESLSRFGLFRGGYLAMKRIGRCHPFGGSGVDFVPPWPDHEKKEKINHVG